MIHHTSTEYISIYQQHITLDERIIDCNLIIIPSSSTCSRSKSADDLCDSEDDDLYDDEEDDLDDDEEADLCDDEEDDFRFFVRFPSRIHTHTHTHTHNTNPISCTMWFTVIIVLRFLFRFLLR